MDFLWRDKKGKNMFSKTYCAAITGIDAIAVQVEADVGDGLPMFELVGFLASEVKEAKERVKVAIRNSNFLLPPKRITVNLSPADIRKEGTAFDLSIAVAILTASGFIPQKFTNEVMFAGELSLDGKINPVTGILPIACAAKKYGFKSLIVAKDNALEGAMVSEINVIGVSSLSETVQFLLKEIEINPEQREIKIHNNIKKQVDFSEVAGQMAAKRAIEVAVAGWHNIMMYGSPGSGKTMLAKRVPTIMPKLTFEESLELSKVYSVAGKLSKKQLLLLERPFRSPHHTITQTALIGGGRIPKPGEISLASYGVLFLDELTEFKRDVIEVLRQPLEEKLITVTRLNASYLYPANFMLVAALNPCPCGYYPDRNLCRCSEKQIRKYLGKLSQPLLDRIDICVETVQIKYQELEREGNISESSYKIQNRIKTAHKIQKDRYNKLGIFFNSQLTPKEISKYCILGEKEKAILEKAFYHLKLSARAYHKILKVARTIADLEESEKIQIEHLSEAIKYRLYANDLTE